MSLPISVQKTSKFAVLGGKGEEKVEVIGKLKSQSKDQGKNQKVVSSQHVKSAEPESATLESSKELDLEDLILKTLGLESKIEDTWMFSQERGIDHQSLIGTVKSLLVDRYVCDEQFSVTFWALTNEGMDVKSNGSAEVQVFNAIPAEGIEVAELNKLLGETAKIGVGVCMKNKWIKKDGSRLVKVVSTVKDETVDLLEKVSQGQPANEEELKNLKKRKLVQQITRKSYRITKGPDFSPIRVKKMADLHKSMLDDKEEVKCSFKTP